MQRIPPSPSADTASRLLEALRPLVPEAFRDGKLDLETFGTLLGNNVEAGDEKYGLNWQGKRVARQAATTPSLGTLRPTPGESVDWDTTRNLMLEGDNLEILRLLQKSYAGKIKLIYIDPPYNTGKDFVYPDDYSDSILNYQKLAGWRGEDGEKVSSMARRSEAGGRFHTAWLNMMYPRLKLAWPLLRDNGFLFISIDDGEHANLRLICNEIFGEENFVGNLTWEKRSKAQNTETARDMLQSKTEYILVYRKGVEKARFRLIVSGIKEYDQKDEKGAYRLKEVESMSARGMRGRETMQFPILGIDPPADHQWKFGRDFIKRYEDRGDLFLIEGTPHLKMRPGDESEENFLPFWSLLSSKDVGTAESGKAQLNETLGTKAHGFETVKPTDLIRKLLYHCSTDEGGEPEIILDFFAGSGTTPHAVMEQNLEDGRNRRWIAVQFPEPCDPSSETCKAGFPTIAELTKSRIRSAGRHIGKSSERPMDTGFRVFKLDTSNLKIWNPQTEDLKAHLLENESHVVADRSDSDLLTEIMLRLGIDLAAPINSLEVAGKKHIQCIDDGKLFTCFSSSITEQDAKPLADAIANWKSQVAPNFESRAVFLDSAFVDDSVKSNLENLLLQHGFQDGHILSL